MTTPAGVVANENNGNSNDNQSFAISMAVSQAVETLQQEHQGGFGFSAMDDVDYASGNYVDKDIDMESDQGLGDDEDIGMTQEVMGPDFAENSTDSATGFDQWMATHATLDSGNVEDLEYEDCGSAGEDENTESDIRSAWQNAKQKWSSDDKAISITSSTDNEDDDRYDSEYGSENGSEYSIETSGCGDDMLADSELVNEASVANAMLYLTELAAAESTNPDMAGFQQVKNSFARPPLPPSHILPSISDMHQSINDSIDRSLAIVNGMYLGCEDADTLVPTSEHETDSADDLQSGESDHQSEEAVTQTSSKHSAESAEQPNQKVAELKSALADSNTENDKLKTQLVKINTELYQLESEKADLLNHIKFMEQSNAGYLQNIDQLEEQVAQLKERLQHAAAKAATISEELSAEKKAHDATKQTLAVASCESADLKGKCAGFKADIQRLTKYLQDKQSAHENTQQQLIIARDNNSSEQQRIKLELHCAKLDKKCAEFTSRLSQAHNKERLLLSTNTALEARLGDALRKLAEPIEPSDIITDHQRSLDAQLVEARSEAKVAKENFTHVKVNLENEKQNNILLRNRILELEAMVDLANENSRKRKIEHSPCSGAGSAKDAKQSSQATILAQSKPLNRSDQSDIQQVVIDAGERAQDRRRKYARQAGANGIGTTPITSHATADRRLSLNRLAYSATGDKPVTPRIHLHRAQPESYSSPSARSAENSYALNNGAACYSLNKIEATPKQQSVSAIQRGNRPLKYRML
ncbi:hypothetical protein GGI25_005791 [Coemansia spiralis]|uniref:Uncharacterized protein n=2 Tax=Coemansia TaxID=4863 RepID=A0A9W8G1P7_9FUNG|nr:hypothetical protein BX070DRAFT_234706 [Coemansia spiralis]KAJ1987368.1 hypothetical protein EDC05_005868 [Coemansia umbellata]KAJ2619287.1 hypothetical protein GGI26_005966 [Coemansia sp. RSA 1358]KAJ2670622.1 hypothetical protein GGI25_005791 [Coemansia spiralis]